MLLELAQSDKSHTVHGKECGTWLRPVDFRTGSREREGGEQYHAWSKRSSQHGQHHILSRIVLCWGRLGRAGSALVRRCVRMSSNFHPGVCGGSGRREAKGGPVICGVCVVVCLASTRMNLLKKLTHASLKSRQGGLLAGRGGKGWFSFCFVAYGAECFAADSPDHTCAV